MEMITCVKANITYKKLLFDNYGLYCHEYIEDDYKRKILEYDLLEASWDCSKSNLNFYSKPSTKPSFIMKDCQPQFVIEEDCGCK